MEQILSCKSNLIETGGKYIHVYFLMSELFPLKLYQAYPQKEKNKQTKNDDLNIQDRQFRTCAQVCFFFFLIFTDGSNLMK